MSNFTKHSVLLLLLFISCAQTAEIDNEICKSVETVNQTRNNITSTPTLFTQVFLFLSKEKLKFIA